MAPPLKRRKLGASANAPAEISFDPTAREEYLTGFHKRKLARAKHAQEENAKREKEEKLRFRRELRQQRKVDLEKHVQEVNRLVRQANGEISEEAGSSDGDEVGEEDGNETIQEPEPIDHEDEYIDEDKYTTVTVETVGIDKLGFSKPGKDDDEGEQREDEVNDKVDGAANSRSKKTWTKERPRNNKPKQRKKKFRYETKTERKAERMKQGMKKRKQKEARTKI